MFDDFVQNSSSRGRSSDYHGPNASSKPSAQSQQPQDGFEPGGPPIPVTSLETGFVSSADPQNDSPIFQLGRVQYSFPAPLALLTVSANILTMCLYAYPRGAILPQNLPPPPRLVRINLDEPERTEEAEVALPGPPRNRNAGPPDASQVGPHKMFADPTGKHLVLCMRNGDNFYWTSGLKKARLMPRWRGFVIESIAWHPEAAAAAAGSSRSGRASGKVSSTREILVGTRNGDIYEAVLTSPSILDDEEGDFLDRLARRTAGAGSGGGDIDRIFRHLFSLSERQAISGLSVNHWSSQSGGHPAKAAIVATTSTRIYEFVGALRRDRKEDSDSSLYAPVFQPYRGSIPNLKSELPGDVPYSELRVWSPSPSKNAKALAWLTGPGVYHASLKFSDQDVGGSVIESANLLPYPAVVGDEDDPPEDGGAVAEVPSGIALTAFHFVLLYSNRVMCIGSLDDRVVFEEALPLKPQERVIGTCVDISRKTYWIYTDASIFELVIQDEDRDIWKVFLDRGAHDQALKYVKSSSQRDIVLSAQGDRCFAESRYIQAAQCYAQSFTRTFEEVVLRLLDVDARDALRYYLVTRLERLKKTDVTQRVLLATWLVEIYLSKLDQLEDIAAAQAASEDVENYHLERNLVDEELRQFLATYQGDLDKRTTFSLISKHGRPDIMLHYASIVGEHERIVRHWLQEEEWQRAIDAISKQPELDLYYRFSPTLMRQAPAELVEAWKRREDLAPKRLIPAMLQHHPKAGEDKQAILYLQHVVYENQNADSAVHNFLLTLLASDSESNVGDGGNSQDNDQLLAFILNGPADPSTGSPYYDLDYALRVCVQHKRHEASVRIFAKMGFFENAVNLALEQGDVDLACFCADLVETDETLRRKLWLKTAKFVVESKQDISAAMEFLSLTPLLSIEDVLPFFPDFTVIDSFKEEICHALESYATRIEGLKSEMDEATQSAKHIQEDINKLSQRFVTVEPDDICGICSNEVLSRQFYVFPCRHAFHADCLIAETTRRLPRRLLRRLLDLQTQLSKVTAGAVPALPTAAAATAGGQNSGRAQSMQQDSAATSYAVSSLSRRAGISTAAAQAAAAVSGVGLDRLPEAIIGVLSAGVSVSVAGGKRVLAPLDPFSEPVVKYTPRTATSASAAGKDGTYDDGVGEGEDEDAFATRREREEMREVSRLREEMDAIIAANCPLCEGSLPDLSRSFLARGNISSAAADADRKLLMAAARKEEEEWAL